MKKNGRDNVQELLRHCYNSFVTLTTNQGWSIDSFDPYQVFEVQHEQCHVLTVKVVKGTNISKGFLYDIIDKPDPFVVLRIPGTPNGKKRTEYKSNNVNPEWNEEFTFFIDPKATSVLEVTLMEANYVKHTELGTRNLSIDKIPLDKTVEKILTFENDSMVHLELHREVDKTPDLRYSLALCDEEKDFLAKRRKKVAEGMKKLLGDQGARNEYEVPVVAVLGSGGGFRALTAFSGVYKALKDSGVLDCVTYMAGLSGSAWFLSTLYSHPKFPDLTPDELQKELKENISKDWRRLLLSDSVPYMKKLLDKYKKGQPVSFTDMFGHLLGDVLIPDRKASSKLTDQQKTLSTGDVPMPLYTCLHVKENVSARVYQEWFEFSPYEIGISKYGTFMRAQLFGSKFIMGRLIKQFPESPLHFLQGVWGSAFTILLRRYIQEKGDRKSAEMTMSPSFNDFEEEEEMLAGNLDIFENAPDSSEKSEKDYLDIEKASDTETEDEDGSDTDKDETDEALFKCRKPLKPPSLHLHFQFRIPEKEEESLQTHANLNGVINGGFVTRSTPSSPTADRKKNSLTRLQRKGAMKVKQPSTSSRSSSMETPDFDEDTRRRLKYAAQSMFPDTNSLGGTRAKNQSRCRASMPNLDVPSFKVEPKKSHSASSINSNAGGVRFWRNRKTIKKKQREEKAQSFFSGLIDKILSSDALDTRAIRAGRIYNPFRGLSLRQTHPVSPFSVPLSKQDGDEDFSGHNDAISTESKRIYVVDSGLTFNLPFPLVLRPQRGVDIFLSFDFSGRQSDDHPPFETLKVAERWAQTHRIPFPPVKELAATYEYEPVRECYVFKDPKDPKCPVIIHFIIVNEEFRKFSAPGVWRTPKEREEANFSIFSDPDNPYSLFNFHYSEKQYERLANLMEFNTRLHINDIKQHMINVTMLRRSIHSSSTGSVTMGPVPQKRRLSRLRSVQAGLYSEESLRSAKKQQDEGKVEIFLDALRDVDQT